MIDKATVQKIKDAADIVEVVGDYVHLIRRGSNYMGLCPFHNERTPSFSVSRRRNFCYCFSCHKGGSPVNFIMEKEGISYHDALLRLADKYGIKVEEREQTDEERRQQSERESMLVANEWAMQLMTHYLTETDEGRDIGLQYFYQRGLTDQAIKAFKLGYAPERGDTLVNEATHAGYDLDVLKTLGLVGTSQRGTLYDRFHGRVIFPILNSAGKVVAFGGRDLKGTSPAKYINSPESSLYKKSSELYGIYQAREAIRREGKCFLVEGYMDVIGMWQSGMENVIASSGTALTDGQIALIHRFADKVTLIYDGDNAGIKAALRGIDMLLAHKLEVKVLLLPDGHDPDSFARQNTPEQFREYVEKHETDIIRFKTKILINETKNDPGSRSQAIRSIVTTLANIPDRITRNVYIQECSRLLEIDESIISRETEESRIAIVQQWRKRKELERLNDEEHKDSNSANLATETQGQISIATTTNPIEHETDTASKSKLQPFEHEVIRYLVQYGMMRFSESVDHEGWAGDINVAMYVNKELEEDSVEFSTPIYKRIFTIIKEMQSDYDTDFKAFQAKVEIQRKEMLKNGYAKIAEQGLDTDSILKAEKKLEEDVEDKAQKDLIDFSRDYVSRKLASDEDNDVRLTVTRLISSPYVLSKYHKKTGNIENEADKLTELIPRAIMEWKDGILAEELIALKDKIRLSDNDENTIALMKQFNDYVELRRELAKMIGDRILTH